MARAQQDLNRVEARIAMLSEQLRSMVMAKRSVRREEKPSAAALRAYELHGEWLHRQLREAQAERDRRRADLDRELEKLAEARKRLRVLEKLRDRQWERYLEEGRREERKESDETAMQQHLSGRRHGDRVTA